MKRFKNTLFYIGIIGGFSALIYWILLLGAKLEIGRNIVEKETSSNHWNDFLNSMVHNLEHPLALLLAQIITIIFVADCFVFIPS